MSQQADHTSEGGMHLVTARDAAEYLCVSIATLDRMEKQGELVPYRTLGGHRRYSLAKLNEWLEQSRGRCSARAPAAPALMSMKERP